MSIPKQLLDRIRCEDHSNTTATGVHHFIARLCSLIPLQGNALGLDDWLPRVDPVKGDNFCGIDRSIDVPRFSGNRIGVLPSARETLEQAAALSCREGGHPDLYLAPQKVYLELFFLAPLNSYSGAQFYYSCGFGRIEIVPTNGNVAYLLQSDTWVAHKNGSFITLACNRLESNVRVGYEGAITLLPEVVHTPRCVCGSGEVTGPAHSRWCDIFEE